MSNESETEQPVDGANLMMLARVVTEARVARNWSIRETARATGLNPMQLSRLERGELKAPSPHTLYQLGQVLGLPYPDLMRLAGYAAPVSGQLGNEEAAAHPEAKSSAEGLLLRAAAPFTEDELEAMLAFLRFYRQRSPAYIQTRVESAASSESSAETPQERQAPMPTIEPITGRPRRRRTPHESGPRVHHAS